MRNEGLRPYWLLLDSQLPKSLDCRAALTQLFGWAEFKNLDLSISTSDGAALTDPRFVPCLLRSIKQGRIVRVIFHPETCADVLKNLPQQNKDILVRARQELSLQAYQAPVEVKYSFVVVGREYFGLEHKDKKGKWFVCGKDLDSEPEKHENFFNRLAKMCHYLSPDDLNGVLMGQPSPLTASLKS